MGIAPNKATKTKIRETENLAGSLYMILKREGWFKTDLSKILERYTKLDEKRYKLRQERMLTQVNMLQRKLAILDNDNFNSYLDWNNQHVDWGITKEDVFVEFVTLFCHMGLVYHETLKRFFIHTLHKNKLVTKNSYITYGAIVQSFNKNLVGFTSNMNKMLDKEFRNSLAHDTWYFDDNVEFFSYSTSEQTKVSIPFYEIPMKIISIMQTYETITDKYYKDFMPKNMKYYEVFEGPAMFNDVPLMLAAYEMALSNKIKEDDPYES